MKWQNATKSRNLTERNENHEAYISELKRFDVPVELGGVNRIAPVEEWGSFIVKKYPGRAEEIRSCKG